MKIIKVGQLPEERTYRGSCFKCGTQFECTQGEGFYHGGNQREGEFIQVACPYCGYTANAYPTHRR